MLLAVVGARRSVVMSAEKRSVAERVPAPVLAGLSTAMVFAEQVSWCLSLRLIRREDESNM